MSSDIKLEQDSVTVEGTLSVSEINGLDCLIAKDLIFKIVGIVENKRAYQFVIGNWMGKYILFCDAERFTIKNPAAPNNKFYSTIEHTTDDSLIINKGNCYSGGVKVDGDLTLSGNIKSQKPLKIGGVSFGYDSGQSAVTDGGMVLPKQELILTPSTIKVKTDYIGLPGKSYSEVKDLVEEIRALRSELDALKKKLGN